MTDINIFSTTHDSRKVSVSGSEAKGIDLKEQNSFDDIVSKTLNSETASAQNQEDTPDNKDRNILAEQGTTVSTDEQQSDVKGLLAALGEFELLEIDANIQDEEITTNVQSDVLADLQNIQSQAMTSTEDELTPLASESTSELLTSMQEQTNQAPIVLEGAINPEVAALNTAMQQAKVNQIGIDDKVNTLSFNQTNQLTQAINLQNSNSDTLDSDNELLQASDEQSLELNATEDDGLKSANIKDWLNQANQDGEAKITNTNINKAETLIAPTQSTQNKLESILNQAQTADTKVQQTLTEINVPVHDDKWGKALGDKLIMMVNAKSQNAMIRLDPPHLGAVDVSITIDKGEASITFNTEHLSVKDVIESSIDKLKAQLQAEGLNLVDVNVSQQETNEQRQGANRILANNSQQTIDSADDDLENTQHISNHLIDKFV